MSTRFIRLFFFGALACGASCFPKTELRHCIDSSGEVQAEQLCILGKPGVVWAYGGRPDPDHPSRLLEYKLQPDKDANVVDATGTKPP